MRDPETVVAEAVDRYGIYGPNHLAGVVLSALRAEGYVITDRPEGAAYIHDGEDGSAPLIHVCRFGDSVTVHSHPVIHVRLDHAEREAPDA